MNTPLRLPQPPMWATLMHVGMVGLATAAILLPLARVPAVGFILGLGCAVQVGLLVVQLKRARALDISLGDFARTAPTSWTPRDTLQVLAMFLATWVVTFTV